MGATTSRMRSKVLLSLGFLSTATITLLAMWPRPVGYEPSVYGAIVPYGAIIVGICLMVLYGEAIFNHLPNVERDGSFGLLIVSIVLVKTSVLLLPAIRGYDHYGRADVSSIIAEIRYIAENGQPTVDNVYPAAHFIVVTLHDVTGVPVEPFVFGIPIFFTGLTPLFFWCLATALFDNRRKTYLTTLGGTVLLLSYRSSHVLFDQQALSLIVIPLVLYTLFRLMDGDRRMRYAFFLLVLTYPFFHPVTLFILIGTLVLTSVAFSTAQFRASKVSATGTFLTAAGLLFIIEIKWFNQGTFFERKVHRLGLYLTGRLGTTGVERNISAIGNFDLWSFILLFVKLLFHDFLFIGLAGLVLIWLLYDGILQQEHEFVILGSWFGVASLVQFLHITTGVVTLFIYRFVGMMAIIAPPLTAVGWARLWERVRRPSATLLLVFLMVSSAVGLASVHPDPFTGRRNTQLTKSEIASMEWGIRHVGPQARFRGLITRPFRLAHRILGIEFGAFSRQTFPRKGYLVPPHFGYSVNNSSTKIPADDLVLFTPPDRQALTSDQGRALHYARHDYKRLAADPRVEKVYDNGIATLWRVGGTSKC